MKDSIVVRRFASVVTIASAVVIVFSSFARWLGVVWIRWGPGLGPTLRAAHRSLNLYQAGDLQLSKWSELAPYLLLGAAAVLALLGLLEFIAARSGSHSLLIVLASALVIIVSVFANLGGIQVLTGVTIVIHNHAHVYGRHLQSLLHVEGNEPLVVLGTSGVGSLIATIGGSCGVAASAILEMRSIKGILPRRGWLSRHAGGPRRRRPASKPAVL